jgi:ABC-type uncharacterized transport system permease subunit
MTALPPFPLIVDFAALIALVPASVLPFRDRAASRGGSWAIQGVALAGALVLVAWRVSVSWDGGLATALWLSIGATLIAYAWFAVLRRPIAGLLPLLAPYLLIVATLATILDIDLPPGAPAVGRALPELWVALHIVVSLSTYALVTLAALAGLAVILREHSLKAKREPGFVAILPPMREAERLQFRALVAAEIVLGLGIVSGMVLEVAAVGTAIVFDHKTVLSLIAFVVLGVLLISHAKAGLRGRRASRFALAAYLLITLAYPGVKAVHQILITG